MQVRQTILGGSDVESRSLNQPVTDERHLRKGFEYKTETGSVLSTSLRLKRDDSRAEGEACKMGPQVRVVYPDGLIGVLQGLANVQVKGLGKRQVAEMPVPEETDSTIEPMRWFPRELISK